MNIDKNIPLPTRKKRKSKWDILATMEVGDSFVVEAKNPASTKAMISNAKRNICPDAKLAFMVEGQSLRVWRKA